MLCQISSIFGWLILRPPELSLGKLYLSRLKRDSIGTDFQSVRKLTNYICAKPLESRLSYLRSSDQEIDCAGALISFGYLIDFLVYSPNAPTPAGLALASSTPRTSSTPILLHNPYTSYSRGRKTRYILTIYAVLSVAIVQDPATIAVEALPALKLQ